MPLIPCCIAIAAPDSPAIRLWLSLVGMPREEAAALYYNDGEQRRTQGDQCVSGIGSKIHHVAYGSRDRAVDFVMTRTPRKLKTALIQIAVRSLKHPVVIHVAIALGASVHPLTKMTPSVSRTVSSKMGFGIQKSPSLYISILIYMVKCKEDS